MLRGLLGGDAGAVTLVNVSSLAAELGVIIEERVREPQERHTAADFSPPREPRSELLRAELLPKGVPHGQARALPEAMQRVLQLLAAAAKASGAAKRIAFFL